MKNETFNELIESIQQGGTMLRKKRRSLKRMAKRKNDNWKIHESLVHYFEHSDLGERLSVVEHVQSAIKVSKREFVVSVNNDIAKSLALIAKRKKISSTTLLQRWVNEKVAENSTAAR